MTQYIDKSALVAEIERMIEHNTEWKDACKTLAVLAANQAIEEDKKILSIIDTLEVKEVDFNKEIDLVEDKYYGFESLSRADIIDVAKHFFEFGMSVSIKVQSLESVLDRIDNKIERCIYNNGRKIDYENVVMMISKEIKNIRQELKAQKGE